MPDAKAAARPDLRDPGRMSPAYCRMFLDARRILGLAEWDLAQRLGTSVDTIRALEAGHLSALPPWPETSRIVTAYLTGLGMDARPVLHSLAHDLAMLAATPPQAAASGRSQTAAGQWRGAPPAASERASSGPDTRRSAAATAAGGGPRLQIAVPRWVHRLGRTPRNLAGAADGAARTVAAVGRRAMHRVASARSGSRSAVSWRTGAGARAATAVAVVLVLIAAVAQTSLAGSVMTAAGAPLPASLTRAIGKVADMVRLQLAPVRDGLRWIEVDDPRSRRGDKLQTARR